MFFSRNLGRRGTAGALAGSASSSSWLGGDGLRRPAAGSEDTSPGATCTPNPARGPDVQRRKDVRNALQRTASGCSRATLCLAAHVRNTHGPSTPNVQLFHILHVHMGVMVLGPYHTCKHTRVPTICPCVHTHSFRHMCTTEPPDHHMHTPAHTTPTTQLLSHTQARTCAHTHTSQPPLLV